jgi:HemY protein
MIRIALVVFLVTAAAVAVLAIAGDPGRASLTWLGWRADTTAAAAMLMILLLSLSALIGWRTLIWILEAPKRARRAREVDRRRQANDVLTRGFLAAAAGDGSEARRLAQKALELANDTPGLVRLLAAQAAEAAQDTAAAEAAYTAMLADPEMRLAGRRGLMLLAAQAGGKAAALAHAEAAYGEARTARWAWRALLEARLEAGQWTEALELVKTALDRKIVPPIVAERTRAALLAASAAELERGSTKKTRAQALDQALEAARLQPGFAPGVALAARLLASDNKAGRAAALIEQAWKTAPHPALWLAYRDLVTDETPHLRAMRLRSLAEQNAGHRESRILDVEQALIAGDAAAAKAALARLGDAPVTARTAGLFARAAFAAGAPDEARLWLVKGVSAPGEPDWSDLDPEGRAFDYGPQDWARLAQAFGERGELVHPRHERGERPLSELPELPLSYVDNAALLNADGSPPQFFPLHEPDDEPDAPAPAPRRTARPAPRRRPGARS